VVVAILLHKLPFFDIPTTAAVFGQPVRVKRDQIILWISVSLKGGDTLPSHTSRFPVVLDTGASFNFAIREEQLNRWAGFDLGALPRLGRIRVSGQEVPLLAANVWVHRNRPGERDTFLDVPPYQLELDGGIAVYPRGMPNTPRLPILGLRALRRAKLFLAIDCQKGRVSLRTSWRFWPFV
jgi:hypothetical protein